MAIRCDARPLPQCLLLQYRFYRHHGIPDGQHAIGGHF
ncbi:protein of unknown function [Burkholderia multivorans]